jgi:hypothetical protein
MTPAPHPLRCETCDNKDCPFGFEAMYLVRLIPNIMRQVGCASHSASSDVLEEYTGIRPEVMRFAAAMELVLRKNDYKGGWREMGSYKLLERAYEELEECRREMRESKSGCMRRASREMVDAAAFCMMFFDNLYSMPINDEYLENKLKELRQQTKEQMRTKEREQR